MKIDTKKLEGLIQEFVTSVAGGNCAAGATIGAVEGKVFELIVMTEWEARSRGNLIEPLEQYKCITESEPKTKRYVYFVSYVVDDKYHGWHEVSIRKEITCKDDLYGAAQSIARDVHWGDYDGPKQIKPVNFILLRTEEL